MTLTVASLPGVSLGTAAATGTITDDDALTVAVTAGAETVVEGNDATFPVAVTGGTSTAPVAVSYTVGGTATAGTDYTAPSGTLTLGAADASGTIAIATLTDSVLDGGETLIVTLTGASTSAGEVTADPTPAPTTISDEGTVTVSVTSGGAVAEGSPAEFEVALSGTVASAVEVGWSTADDTATAGDDYTAVALETLTFAANSTQAQTITVATLGDALAEDDETFTVTLTVASLPGVSLGTAAATMTIIDDDTLVVNPPRDPPVVNPPRHPPVVRPPRHPPEVSIAAQAVTVEEGGAASFTVSRSGSTAQRLTVSVEVTESGSFIAGAVPVEARFEANADRAILQIATTDDAIDEPDGSVTVVLAAGDGYVVADPVSATVTVTDNDEAPELTIGDVRAVESAGRIEFTVRLAAVSGYRVMVTCAAVDGTATANADYVPVSGPVILEPGRTSRTVRVVVLDDTLHEPDETFTLVLSDPSHATLADAEATGTIEDDDESGVQAWLARFGRTAAGHVVDAVGERVRAASAVQSQATISGRRLQGSTPDDDQAARAQAWERWLPGDRPRDGPRTMQLGELVAGSSFDVAAPTAAADTVDQAGAARRWTVWGRGAWSTFAGTDDGLTLRGEVLTATVGADYAIDPLLLGLAVAYSAGHGTIDHTASRTSAELRTALLGVHPYLRLALHERLSIWGLAGYALLGGLTLDAANAAPIDTEAGMLMGALGLHSTLIEAARTGGFELAVSADGMVVSMRSDAAPGRLRASRADIARWRLLLRASYHALPLAGGFLTPSLEIGGRIDAGDAGTGRGLVLSGGLDYTLPAWGLSLAASGQGLLLTDTRGFSEWGADGFLLLDPGAPGRGVSLRVAPSWGAGATDAAALWSLPDASPLVAPPAPFDPAGRLDGEIGYGLAIPGDQGSLTPYLGLLQFAAGRTWRLGARLQLDSDFTLTLEGSRKQRTGIAPRHSVALSGFRRY